MTADQETALAELAAAFDRWQRVYVGANRALDANIEQRQTMEMAGDPPPEPVAFLRGPAAWKTAMEEAMAEMERAVHRAHELDDGDEEYRNAVRAISDRARRERGL